MSVSYHYILEKQGTNKKECIKHYCSTSTYKYTTKYNSILVLFFQGVALMSTLTVLKDPFWILDLGIER